MTDQQLWNDVDDMICAALVPGDEALRATLEASAAAGLPAIHVAPNQGRFLSLLVRATRATRVLEVGTLGGYSAIWMARALLKDGRLVTLEADPHHASVARSNLARAGLGESVEVVVGDALETLPRLAATGRSFDLVFIDADKVHSPDYFDWALRLVTAGGVIVVDNVVRAGAIADANNTTPEVDGVRRLFAAMAAAPGVEASAVQTVGAKGHDGFALAWVGEN